MTFDKFFLNNPKFVLLHQYIKNRHDYNYFCKILNKFALFDIYPEDNLFTYVDKEYDLSIICGYIAIFRLLLISIKNKIYSCP